MLFVSRDKNYIEKFYCLYIFKNELEDVFIIYENITRSVIGFYLVEEE